MGGIGSKALRAWLLVLLCVALIWTLSGESYSAASTSRYLTSFLRWLCPEISWRAILRVHLFVRKGAHVTEYAVLTMLAFRALRLSLDLSTPHLVGRALALVVAVAAVDEVRQSFTATRSGSLADVALDFAGGALGVGLVVAFQRRLGIRAPAGKKDT